MQKHEKKTILCSGFTLVELIVVITILAILGTIAIMAFSGYSKNARDSARISDISRITSSVELFQVAKGFLPEPTTPRDITYSGAIAWIQGTFGDATVTNVEKISKKPVDPLTGSEYAYSITNAKKEYQIGAIYEGDNVASVVNQTYAAGTKTQALVKGNYNGSILKVSTGGLDYVLAVPSILASDIDSSTDVTEIVNNKSLVFNKYNNLPASYKGTSYNISGGFDFNPVNGNIVAFSGTGGQDFLKDPADQTIFVDNLQAIYGGTNVSTTPEIANILSYDTEADTEGTALLAQVLIHGYVNSNVGINSNTPVGGGGSQGNSSQSGLMVMVGMDYACALLSNKTVVCWGDNEDGQLGDGTQTERHTPVAVNGITNAEGLSLSQTSMCALLSDKTVKCWGANYDGQLGDGTGIDSLIPVSLAGSYTFTQIDGTCGLLTNKTVVCWGANYDGQLGNGTTVDYSLIPVPASGLTNVKYISVGDSRSVCATLENGEAWCWGNNGSGQLGVGDPDIAGYSINLPVNVLGGYAFSYIEVGDSHSCGLLTNKTVRCWGSGGSGRLGNGTNVSSFDPVLVSGLGDVLTLSTQRNHTCVIIQGGNLKCWGRAYKGALGNNMNTDSNIPVDTGLVNVAKVSAGSYGTSVVLTNGTVFYFGENRNGVHANGTLNERSSPVVPEGNPSDVLSLGLGDLSSCLVLNNGTIKCMGNGSELPFGDSDFDNGKYVNRDRPTLVSGETDVKSVKIGNEYDNIGCLLTNAGSVKCWGNGIGSSPVDMGITDIAKISVWHNYGCAITNTGSLKCWGDIYGPTPVDITGITGLSEITAPSYLCGIFSPGEVKCWTQGLNPTPPVVLPGVTNPTKLVSFTSSHSCVIDGGQLKCFGTNWSGQFGNGTTGWTNFTVENSFGSLSILDVAVGYNFTCVVVVGGEVKCSGNNEFGQLGDGTTNNSLSPITVPGISTAVSIEIGKEHVCVKLSDNTVKCWGKGSDGQIGNAIYGHKVISGLN